MVANWLSDDDALIGDLVQPKLVAVGAAAYLDDRHHAFQVALDFDVTLYDDCVS